VEVDIQTLIEVAGRARDQAMAKFSNFKVGAALETFDGRIFSGCNIENATYGLTVCAERVAIWKAISEGVRQFKAIAILADTGEQLITPCGACRQIIWEFCGDITIIMANLIGDHEIVHTHDLLPRAFDAKYLKD
jgi:cytidine deaminase